MTSLKKELFSGVFYSGIAKYSGTFISLVVAGVLARLITPEEFGVMAVALVIISFFGIFSDIGISPAIVQNKMLGKTDLAGLFIFTCWMGLGLSLLFFLCSWPIAAYYQNPELRSLCQILSVNLLFVSVNIVPNALLMKARKFKFIAWRTLIVQSICGIVAIGIAIGGGGLYALLVNPVLSSILLFVISYRKYPQPLHYATGLSPLKKIFHFSSYQFLFNVLVFFSRNLDKLLIGKYMGMILLGYYEKSYRLMMLPLQNITYVITPVMHPVFSSFQHDLERLADSYEKIVRFLAFIGFSLSVFLWFDARELTLIIFGRQWESSVPIFRILALSVGVQVINSTSGSIFQASNDTKSLFICGLFSAILNVSGILTGIFYFNSLKIVAWCICLTFFLSFLQCYFIMYYVTFKKRNIISFGSQFVSPLILSIIQIVILLGVSVFTESLELFSSLVIKGFVWASVTALYIQFTGEYNLFEKTKSLIRKYNKSTT